MRAMLEQLPAQGKYPQSAEASRFASIIPLMDMTRSPHIHTDFVCFAPREMV
jgi:hypothetical protein